jgi:tetratricopeptide (TPR) repeat protein
MKRIFSLLITLALSASAWALAPEIEMDRLLIQAKTALDASDYAQATESLSKAEKLGVKLPPTFYYHYGRAYAGTGKLEQGRDMLEKYLNMSGTRGKFYQEALVALNNIESTLRKREADAAALAEQKKIEKQIALKKYEEALNEYNQKLATYERGRNDCPFEYANKMDRQRKSVMERNMARSRGNYDSSKDPEAEALWEKRNDRDAQTEYCNDRYREPKRPIPPQ